MKTLLFAVCVFSLSVANAEAAAGSKVDTGDSKTADRMLSANVRQAIKSDKSISAYSRRVKVISQNGIVTLTGPVLSQVDKNFIQEDAEAVMGRSDRINNQTTTQH